MKKHFLDILGEKYQIIPKDELNLDGVSCVGACFHEQKEIHILNGLSKEDEMKTYLHEIFHASFFELCLNQTDIDKNVQEILAEGFSRIIAKNFKLTRKK